MPIHVYECGRGHKQERIETIHEDATGQRCNKLDYSGCAVITCKARLKLSAAVSTAPPKFKRGVGGFYKPTS